MRLLIILVGILASIGSTRAQSPDWSGTFEVHGRNMYIECFGTGSPTIILAPGEGRVAREYRLETEPLGRTYTACSYNRPLRIGELADAEDFTADLKGLVELAGVAQPFVLMGHSAGGLMSQHYAKTYPEDLLALVALNPQLPAQPWLAAIKQTRSPDLYARDEVYFAGRNDEPFDYMTATEQIAALPPPSDLPFELVLSTSTQCEGNPLCISEYPIEERIQAEVVAAWPKGRLVRVEAGHDVPIPDVEASILRVLATQ